MKIFICDLCFKSYERSWELNELDNEYKTERVKHVCIDCMKVISDASDNFQNYFKEKIKVPFIKRVINNILYKNR